MKKIIPIVIVGILVLSGLGAASFASNVSLKQPSVNVKNISASVQFASQPTFVEKDGFVQVGIDGATTQLLDQNKPVLPVYVKTYEIPFGSSNIQVSCTPVGVSTMGLSQKIAPARIVPVSELDGQSAYVMDESVYGSDALYPAGWYSSDLGAGRNAQGVEVTFVKVVCYPVRYSPMGNEVTFASSFDVSVSYVLPTTPAKSFTDHFDMVVIAPAKFESRLQPLIDEKNAKGVLTTFKSVEDILNEYTGYDQPEQIKYFIKYAYDTWNITYVLLVGGLKNHIYAPDKDTRSAGFKNWWVPVRYVSIPQEEDEGTISDLYYGCLYNGTGGFDSWDSNHDHVYAAWNAPNAQKDTFDMYPEVFVSRLACTLPSEVTTVVNKIIKYEKTGPDAKSWWTTFMGVGGKTFDYYQGKPDGEYLSDLAYNYTKHAIPGLTLVDVYSTNRDSGGLTPTPQNIVKTLNKGASFVDFEGHGNPLSWNTIWFDGTYPNDWTGGLNVGWFPFISNRDKLPVVIVGGCHNALYNITIIAGLQDKTGEDHFLYGVPFPVCFCWGLLVKPRGGAIASTGDTGYGFGSQDDPNTLSAQMEMNFFWEFGYDNATHLGQAHSGAIRKFVSENPMNTQIEAFCVTEWQVFGDPSLLFGGY